MSALTVREKQALARSAANHGAQVLTSVPAAIFLASPNPKLKKIPPDSILNIFPDLTKKKWQYTNISGFLAFVVNPALDAYFFEMYDVETFEMRFQQELYYDMDYKELSKQFHSFELEDCVCGFNFATVEGAANFRAKVLALSPTKKKKKNKERQAALQRNGSFANFATDLKANPLGGGNWLVTGQDSFQQPQTLITEYDLTPEWRAILKNAGIKKRDLKKPEMQQIIREILEEANISASAPPQMTYEEAQQYYNEEEVRQYQQYQEEMRAYEQEMQQYEVEGEAYMVYQQQLAEFEAEQQEQHRQHQGLQKWEEEQAHTMERHKNVTDALGYNKHGVKAPPLPSRDAARQEKKKEAVLEEKPMPKLPVPPKLPALPKIERKIESEYVEEEPAKAKKILPPLPSRETPGRNDQKKKEPPPLPSRDGQGIVQMAIKPTTINRKGKFRSPEPKHTSTKSAISGIPGFMQPTNRYNPFQASMVRSSTGRGTQEIRTTERTEEQRRPPPRGGIQSVMLQGVQLKAAPKIPKEQRASTVLFSQIKKGQGNLKHISRLPDLKKVSKGVKNTLLRRLKERLEKRRAHLEESDDEEDISDDDSDW